jgi:hypothetical protein
MTPDDQAAHDVKMAAEKAAQVEREDKRRVDTNDG